MFPWSTDIFDEFAVFSELSSSSSLKKKPDVLEVKSSLRLVLKVQMGIKKFSEHPESFSTSTNYFSFYSKFYRIESILNLCRASSWFISEQLIGCEIFVYYIFENFALRVSILKISDQPQRFFRTETAIFDKLSSFWQLILSFKQHFGFAQKLVSDLLWKNDVLYFYF